MRRRGDERELEDLPLRVHAALVELALDRAERVEPLLQRAQPPTNQPKPWRESTRPLVAQRLQRPPDRDPAGAELGRQLGLAGQHVTGADRGDPLAQDLGDLLVADRSHVSLGLPRGDLTCIILVYIDRIEHHATEERSHGRHRRNADRAGPRRLRHAGRASAAGRSRLGRPLTLTEKILFNHLDDPDGQRLERGASYADFHPDRVAMQDATAQMALLQFMTAGLPDGRGADHRALRPPHPGQGRRRHRPRRRARHELGGLRLPAHRCRRKYGIGFWKPGCGIIHQVVLENYAFPGGMMIGTDSHTPNAGGLGMVAIGVGGADAVDVMTGFPFNVRWPEAHRRAPHRRRCRGWSAPKDVILKVAGILTVKGGTGAIVEYFGPGADSISATGKATICNMGAEIGATCSLFPYDDAHGRVPQGDRPRGDRRRRRRGRRATCGPTPRSTPTPSVFDQVIEIDLVELEPHLNGPHTPDLARPIVARSAPTAEAEGWPLEISLGARRLVHQLVVRGHHPRRVDRPPGRGQGPAGEDASC